MLDLGSLVWPLNVVGAGMMAQRNHHEPPPPPDPTFSERFWKWAPVVVSTIVLPAVGFLWGEYKDNQKWQAQAEVRFERNEGKIQQLEAYNRAQDTLREAEIAALRERLDAQRHSMDDHISKDDRNFKRLLER